MYFGRYLYRPFWSPTHSYRPLLSPALVALWINFLDLNKSNTMVNSRSYILPTRKVSSQHVSDEAMTHEIADIWGANPMPIVFSEEDQTTSSLRSCALWGWEPECWPLSIRRITFWGRRRAAIHPQLYRQCARRRHYAPVYGFFQTSLPSSHKQYHVCKAEFSRGRCCDEGSCEE